jgi:hypothetical protein
VPSGEFGNTTTATKNNTDGKWYLHLQAKDLAGNLSDVLTVSSFLDNTIPEFPIIPNDPNPQKCKTWKWNACENCTYRFSINQSSSWDPTGEFANTTTATKCNADGIWYLHLQAKDFAGNLSNITVSAILDNTIPEITGLSDDQNPTQSKTWNWGANEICTYRFFIDQNISWQPTGEFGTITTATKSNGDDMWYLHVQAQDLAGNLSTEKVFAFLDNTKPIITGLSDDTNPKQSKIWRWAANENSTFRFSIDQNSSWEPTGEFGSTTAATKTNGDGTWYLHVQAKDLAGNLNTVNVSAILDNTTMEIKGLSNDPNPTKSKTWKWSTDEQCVFRFSIDQNESWQPTGEFGNITTATIRNADGTWYLHVQAKDLAGNLSNITVFTILDNTKPIITGLLNDTKPSKSKTWNWNTDEKNCTFRFSIDQNSNWEPAGEFGNVTTASRLSGDGAWCIHVQAKDLAGNLSEVLTVSAKLDNTNPEITGLSNDTNPAQSKTWNWGANEESCIFRFSIDQSSSWEPTGEFGNTTTATKSNVDGTWYIHVQAKDLAGNLSEVRTVSAKLDNTNPEITGLSNDTNPAQSKTWNWSANEENCIFRFSIDQSSSWVPTGEFGKTTTASKSNVDGTWYIHVQAKDLAGNVSEVRTVFAMLDNTTMEIKGLSGDTKPTKSKTWNWSTDEQCLFRFSIDQNDSWQPTGEFGNTTTASKSNVDGTWYIHVQAKDLAGNVSEVKTVSAILDNTNPEITGLSNDINPTQSKTWNWSSNENCTFRFSINQNSTWQPTGEFANTTTATKSNADETWYLHVQAKDLAGNISSTAVFTILDNTKPEITDLSDDTHPTERKTWSWGANENCTFRFFIDQNSSWEPTGEFGNTTTATKSDGVGTWNLHVQAQDLAGNLSKVVTVSAVLAIPVPQGLSVSNISENQIDLKWIRVEDDFTYNVYKSDSENGFFIKCDPYGLKNSEYIDTDIKGGNQYWYRITAVNSEGKESLFSEAVSATTELIDSDIELIPVHSYAMQIAGSTAIYHLKVNSIGQYSDDVRLSVSDLHEWITPHFNKEVITPPDFVNLELDISNNISENRYTFHVNAIGKNRDDKISLFLDVKNPPYSDSAISLYLNKKQLFLNQSVEIYGSIRPKAFEIPLSIHIQHESENTPTTIKIATDKYNNYQYNYIPEKTGRYTIYSWSGDDEFNPVQSSSIELSVLRGKSRITCQTPDTEISLDKPVQITGKLYMPETAHNYIVLQIVNPDGNLEWIENRIFTESDGSFKYSVMLDKEGIWKISSCWGGNEQYQGVVSSPLRLYPGVKTGKALIVAGGGIRNNNLWKTTKYLTNTFYRILLNRNYPQEMIYYISPDIDRIDPNILIDDQTPAVSDIQDYIERLYLNASNPEVTSDKPLLIYMADHGGPKMFKVNNLEYLKAEDLDLWLDDLQTHTACPVYIILEACYSGTFIENLSPDLDQKRIIITSTGNHVALYDNDGRTSFSQYLFNKLNSGYNLYNSFYSAVDEIQRDSLFRKQFPKIDDGSNGELAKITYIGGPFVEGNLLPEIIDHTPDQILSAGSKELFAVIYDIEGIGQVWVSIMPPNFYVPEVSQAFETPIIDLPKIPLTHIGNDRYEGTYSDFLLNGIYRVTFYCEDLGGNVVSKEILLNVINGQQLIPGDLDQSGKLTLYDAILSLQSIAGMDVTVDASARILCNGTLGLCEGIEILREMVK